VNSYEIVVILHPEFSEDQVGTVTGKLESIIKKNAGEVIAVDKWGKKRFCYTIKKQNEGVYVDLTFKTEPENIDELQNMLKVEQGVLRYLIVKKVEKKPWPVKKKAKKEEKVEQPAKAE